MRHRPHPGFRWWPVPLLVALSALWLGAIAAAASGPPALRVRLAGGTVFPHRSLVVSAPVATALTAARLHLSENGRPISGVSVTPLRHAGLGGLGVVVVIDRDPTMSGAPLAQAVGAARTLAAGRAGSEQLGVIFGNDTVLPLTTDGAQIQHALSRVPTVVAGTNLLAATESAVAELKAANVLDGAVIFVSDDIDRNRDYTPEAVAAFAAAAHVRIFTVGIHDRAYDHPSPQDLPPQAMTQLAQAADGEFIRAAPSQLGHVFSDIGAGLTSDYVVSYTSSASPGRSVRVALHVDGFAANHAAAYQAPAAASLAGRPAPAHRAAAPKPFWSTPLSLLVTAVGAALLLGVAVALIASAYARQGELRIRVSEFIPVAPGEPPPLLLVQARRPLLTKMKWWPAFAERVDISRTTRAPLQLVYLSLLASLLIAAALYGITGFAGLAFLGLFVGPVLLKVWLSRKVRKQRQAFMEQLPAYLEEIAGVMRSGRSIVEAVRVVAEGADEPARGEFDRALADENLGKPLEETIEPIGRRMESSEIDQVALIMSLHRHTGANITEVLDRIAETARERASLRRELGALTAQSRLSRYVLTGLTPAVMLGVEVVSSKYERPLFHTSAGIVALCLSVFLLGIGTVVMNALTKVEE